MRIGSIRGHDYGDLEGFHAVLSLMIRMRRGFWCILGRVSLGVLNFNTGVSWPEGPLPQGVGLFGSIEFEEGVRAKELG